MVIYPTLVVRLHLVEDRALAAALARAYNNWLADFCKPYPQRLFGAAIVPLPDVDLAIAEMRRAVQQLGMKAIIVRPATYGGQPLYAPQFDRFWAAAQELDVAISLHPFPNVAQDGLVSFPSGASLGGTHIADLCSFPMDNMLAYAQFVLGGVFDRFPKLRVALLESNGGWLTMWLERMDNRYRLAAASPRMRPLAPKHLPSEYFARQCVISFEGGEKALPRLVDVVGEDRVLWASDYPHYDCKYPGAVEEVEENIEGLPDRVRRKIVGENAARFFHLPVSA